MDSRLPTLVAALQAAELDDDLQGDGPFMAFAPTDNAFAALPAVAADTLLQPASRAALISILTCHVYSGAVLAADAIAVDGNRVSMLTGDEISTDFGSGSVTRHLGGNRQAARLQILSARMA